MLKQPLQGRLMGIILVSCGLGLCAHAHASEPLCWERTPNRPAPAQFDTFHGESLDFRCTFKGFGTLPFSPSESGALPPRLYYQTNGMGAAWWSLPATVSSNVLAATFPPSADPGAERLTVFFGAPSNAYASAQVRFRDSPGAQPNNLDPPSVLDWMAELSALSNNLARAIANAAPADYATVSNRAMSALQEHQSLAPSTNYTDATAVSLSNNLAAAMSAALDGKANKSHLKRVVYYRNETMDETVDVEMEKVEIWGQVIWRTPWRDGGYLTIVEENGQIIGVLIEEDDSVMELVSNVPPYWGFDGYVPGELTFRAYTVLYGQETLIFRYDLADVVYSDEMPTKPSDIGAQPVLTFDTTPTAGSTNPVTSAGILTALDNATNSLHKSLAPTITNIASTVSSNAIASADTTYRRTIGLTNLNQSVQFVNITDTSPTTIAISMPTDGATKDWMVYVTAVTNVALQLPPVTWWMADSSATNDIPPATPTAFWFSQVTDGIYIIGRQGLTEVTAP